MARVRFSSVTHFCPGPEASGHVVQAQDRDTGRWWYHPGPKGHAFFQPEQAAALCKKIALAGKINENLWNTDYPGCDFEAWERLNNDKQTEAAAGRAQR